MPRDQPVQSQLSLETLEVSARLWASVSLLGHCKQWEWPRQWPSLDKTQRLGYLPTSPLGFANGPRHLGISLPLPQDWGPRLPKALPSTVLAPTPPTSAAFLWREQEDWPRLFSVGDRNPKYFHLGILGTPVPVPDVPPLVLLGLGCHLAWSLPPAMHPPPPCPLRWGPPPSALPLRHPASSAHHASSPLPASRWPCLAPCTQWEGLCNCVSSAWNTLCPSVLISTGPEGPEVTPHPSGQQGSHSPQGPIKPRAPWSSLSVDAPEARHLAQLP